jgi:DNA-binding LacI/PurR family transcriptional regulator
VTDPSARPVSIRDVAARAGVSRQTVSRVLNGLPGMTEQTAAHVRQVMAELGYRPNRAARILASSRHRTIGIITTAATMFGPASIALAIERAARAQGYQLTMVSAASEADGDLASALDELLWQGVDGLVVIAPQARTWPLIQERIGALPALTLQWSGGPARTAALDQHQGAVLATRYLVGLGHTRILHLAGPDGWAEVEQRAAGYAHALAAAGLAPEPLVHGDWTADSGYEIGRRVLPGRGFTAVFASNDQMAIGLLHAAHELGIRVPEELSIVGFDDLPEARHATPPLTTVRQEFGALGEAAIARLVAVIEGADDGADAELTDRTELQVRASTAPPEGRPLQF